MALSGIGERPPRYTVLLTEEAELSHCPTCGGELEDREFLLLVSVLEGPLLTIGHVCGFCSRCDVVVVDAADLCDDVYYELEASDVGMEDKPFLVLGTVDRERLESELARTGDDPLALTTSSADFASVLEYGSA
jgi:hypothetical protein